MAIHPNRNPKDKPDTDTLSKKNVAWIEAIVKWTRYEYVAMYDYPTTDNSEVVKGIFKGDTVQVSRRYRRDDWCLCRVGHVLGWVFLKDVRFIVQGSSAPRPRSRRATQEMQKPLEDTIHDVTKKIPYLQQNNLMETQPMTAQRHDAEQLQRDETKPEFEHEEKLDITSPKVEPKLEPKPLSSQAQAKPVFSQPEPIHRRMEPSSSQQKVKALDKTKKPLIERLINFFKR